MSPRRLAALTALTALVAIAAAAAVVALFPQPASAQARSTR